MSTHDLSRTVIEGGRYHGNTDDRRLSHRQARRKAHAHARRVARDPDRADASSFEPTPVVYVHQRDRLSAAERWLHGHVGRPWWKVEGEIRAAFDTRTIAGQHVVFDHLLPREDPSQRNRWGVVGWRVHRRWTFWVDRHGMLRAREEKWFIRYERHRPASTASEAVRALVGDRRVRLHDGNAYWLEPTGTVRRDGTLGYRQARALDEAERVRWDALRDDERAYATTLLNWSDVAGTATTR